VITGTFDLVMMLASLEHIYQQTETLIEVNRVTNNNGYVLIRIPILTPYVWDKYGINWVQLDAPRHFYLHTLKSFSILANQSGFKIEKYKFDSNEFLFWGSEQYNQEISLIDHRSYGLNKRNSIFAKTDIDQFKKEAKYLNDTQQGDQAAFFLTKK